MWLEEFERVPFRHSGGSFVASDAPPRLILHTTEGGGGVGGQAAYMSGTGNYAHVIADPFAERAGQLISLDRSATTSQNDSGGVETNRLNAIQVEIVWYAGRIRELTQLQLNWLGRRVVAPLCRAKGIKPVPPPRPFVGPQHGFIAREDAPQRLSFAEWVGFNGVCGHQHVPENDHWDPGFLDIAQVLAAARAELGQGPIDPLNPQEEDMGGMCVESPWSGRPKGRRRFAQLIPGYKIVLLKNGAKCVGDRPTQEPNTRVWLPPMGDAAAVDIMETAGGAGFTVVGADPKFGDVTFSTAFRR